MKLLRSKNSKDHPAPPEILWIIWNLVLYACISNLQRQRNTMWLFLSFCVSLSHIKKNMRFKFDFENLHDLIYYIMQHKQLLLVFFKPVNYIEVFFLSNESQCKVKMEEKQDNFSWGHYDSKKKWGKPEMWFMQCTWYWNECGSLHP